MQDVKATLARNIAALRTAHGMTQLEFAEKLNYSDKAVSKWERAESMPDITVLLQIAAIFGVTLDALVSEDPAAIAQREEAPAPLPLTEEEQAAAAAAEEEERRAAVARANADRAHAMIAWMSVLLIWFIATSVYVLIAVLAPAPQFHYLAFVYAIPASAIVWLVFNSIWFRPRRNYFIISLLVWSLLAALVLTFRPFAPGATVLFLLGVPAELAVLSWSRINARTRQ